MSIVIKYDALGKILEGENKGWFIKIIDDTENTGGFYICEFDNAENGQGFDTWLENEEQVKGYFYESGWKIEWLENLQSSIVNQKS